MARPNPGKLVLAVLVALVPMHAGKAQEAGPSVPPDAFEKMQQCMTVSDQSQRLACYDAQMAQLSTAIESGEVVIADREQIREAKRGLFGITLPSFGLFDGNQGDDVDAISDTIAAYRYDSNGRAIMTLANGMRWQQLDTGKVWLAKDKPIRIRRASLGSFLANIGTGSAIRVKRLVD